MIDPVFRIYLVDDEEVIRKSISRALGKTYDLHTFETAEALLETMAVQRADLVLLDIGLPGMSGLEALSRIRDTDPEMLVIMITAYEDAKTIISSMKQGVFDYIVKPLHISALKAAIEKALGTIRLRKEVRMLQQQALKEKVPAIIGESREVRDMLSLVKQVAKSPFTPVMILGETGTGKELIARTIHYRSPNFQGPFVSVNCAAIPDHLIESELFGYTKGAFSGARHSGKEGLIEAADKGTLFLDEVGDLSLGAQAKLLRFLQEGTFFKLGGTKEFEVSARVVCATNRKLSRMVARKKFRKDLFYRLGVVKIEVPSLNERREDILPLARFFLHGIAGQLGKQVTRLSREAEEVLLGHDWEGNIRELKNIIECGVVSTTEQVVSAPDLGVDRAYPEEDLDALVSGRALPRLTARGVDLNKVLQAIERFYIQEAIGATRGNESKAARMLNLNHHTFRYRRRKFSSLSEEDEA